MLIDYNVDDLLHSLGGNRGDKILYCIYAHIYVRQHFYPYIFLYTCINTVVFWKPDYFHGVALLTLTDKHHSKERV